MAVSQWRIAEVLTMEKELLRLIIELVHKHVDLWGTYPSPEQIQQQLTAGK